MIKKIGFPEKKNKELIDIINKIQTDQFYIKNIKDFRFEILKNINNDDMVLDVGKGMRDQFKNIKAKIVHTLDINEFDDYPDIVFDICDEPDENLLGKYDKIICLAILEHVYNPFLAISSLRKMLKKDGVIYGYAPYLYYYHAPEDLKFQDYFRFSKDALAYLFKDFSKVKLYPVRGRVSTPLNILFAGRWKKYIEKFKINKYLDLLSSNEKNLKQCSGFNFILRK